MNKALVLAAAGVGGYVAYRALKPRYEFRDKHVVITGGSRGLGLVMARQFAAAGARLSICSRDPDELARAEAELSARGARVRAVECDVTDRARVREFVAVARAHNGPVDVLVNNAGVMRVGPVEAMGEADYEHSLRTHFWGAFYTVSEVLPEMTARGTGRVVNVSSLGGKVAVPHMLPYAAGKFALTGFSEGLRAEVARHGIVVTTVCPTVMRTGSHLNAEFKGQHEKEYAWFALLNGLPGFSVPAEAAARKILAACARGDAELVIGLAGKVRVAAQAVCPNLMSGLMALANRWLLPAPGGIGRAVAKGRDSRGALPAAATRLIDRAAARNNELHAADVPPPLPARPL